jgi:hypothetical protein
MSFRAKGWSLPGSLVGSSLALQMVGIGFGPLMPRAPWLPSATFFKIVFRLENDTSMVKSLTLICWASYGSGLVFGFRSLCHARAPRAISGWIGEKWLGAAATFSLPQALEVGPKLPIESTLYMGAILALPPQKKYYR